MKKSSVKVKSVEKGVKKLSIKSKEEKKEKKKKTKANEPALITELAAGAKSKFVMESIPERIDSDFMSRYHDWKPLGEGGTAKVFSAHDKTENKTVVLKQIKKTEEDAAVLFYDEVAILKHLKKTCQPYLVCYIDALQTKDHFYIIMEFLGQYQLMADFIDEHDHEKKERKGKKGPNEQVYENMVRNLISAVRTLHKSKVAHRDLKPLNIMVNPKTGDVKLIDFGLARWADKIGTGNEFGGTMGFMAPEIWYKMTGYHRNEKRKEEYKGKQFFTLKQWFKHDYWSLAMCIAELVTEKAFQTYFYDVHKDTIWKQSSPEMRAAVKKAEAKGNEKAIENVRQHMIATYFLKFPKEHVQFVKDFTGVMNKLHSTWSSKFKQQLTEYFDSLSRFMVKERKLPSV